MWKFPEFISGRMIVDPVEQEFFREDSDQRTPRNLVRESIQNSLDSRREDVVRMRFTFGRLDYATVREIYLGLNDHLRAPKSGLLDPPGPADEMDFLVIEDFGTTGLRGDPNQLAPRDRDEDNDFFYFWRNVGRTGKSGSKLGSWGLGKTVYPASSEINSYFGLTCREEDSDRSFLMGMSVLKNHSVGSKDFEPYGYFADHGSGDPLPITDVATVERFRDAFHLHRDSGEPGLSVVIPHVVGEFTVELLKQVAIEQYFWPILDGRLSIEVQENYRTPPETTIDASTLLDLCEQGAIDRELADTIYLASHVIAGNPVVETRVRASGLDSAPKWSDLDVPEDAVAEMRSAASESTPFRVEVELPVRYADARFSMSRFAVLGQPVSYGVKRRSYFVRGGLFIERACPLNPAGYVFLVVVPEDGPLARMLVAAENPSHTTFENTDEIKQKYRHGAMTTISFVRDAALEIARLIETQEQVVDEDLFADVFWKPKKPDASKRRPRPNPMPPLPDPPPVPSPRAYGIEKTPGGFVVRGISVSASTIERISIKAAYDVVGGLDPIKSHRAWDFDFDDMQRDGLELTSEKCEVSIVGVNELIISDLHEGFRVQLRGFDPNRDLIVLPRARRSV